MNHANKIFTVSLAICGGMSLVMQKTEKKNKVFQDDVKDLYDYSMDCAVKLRGKFSKGQLPEITEKINLLMDQGLEQIENHQAYVSFMALVFSEISRHTNKGSDRNIQCENIIERLNKIYGYYDLDGKVHPEHDHKAMELMDLFQECFGEIG